MKLVIFSVYDSKVQSYANPFYANHRGEALRGLEEVANDKTHNIGKYPADFTLFELGNFDSDTGKFVLHSTPISLGVAIEYVKSHDVSSIRTLENPSVANLN